MSALHGSRNNFSLINYVSFVMFGQRVFTMTALMWIRYRNIPVHPDAIRVPLIFSFLFWLITIALVVVPFIEEFTVGVTDLPNLEKFQNVQLISEKFQQTIVGVGLVLMGVFLYIIFMKPMKLPEFLIRFNGRYRI